VADLRTLQRADWKNETMNGCYDTHIDDRTWSDVVREDGVAMAPMAKRVLMVVDSYEFGGAECLLAELGRCAPAGWEISVVSLAPAEQDRNAMLDRLADAELRPRHLAVRKLLDLKGFIQLVRTLRNAPVDVVHAHLDYAAILVPLAARLAGKPVVATLHVNPKREFRRRDWLKERLSVRIPARFGRLVLVSAHAFGAYSDRHGPAGTSWRMIPNGVDIDRYAPKNRQISASGPVWAIIAALRPGKNHVDAVRAWAGVVAAQPNAKLLVIGDGPARDEIEQAITTAGLENSVSLLGRRDDVHELLRGVDGVISASADEALPTALIEAAACGLPVVATDAGGTREIVIDGVNGRLVPVGSVTALTDALLDIIDDPKLAARYGEAGRAIVEQRYSLSAWTGQLDRLYGEVIAGQS
jgi:glycosyltransferase involved in cell wall biosynthesis